MGLFSSQRKLATSSTLRPHSYPQSAEKWELDAKFFTALSQWTLDHPDSTLDRVLQRVNEAIDNGKDYIDLIPDTPFPARGLVKSVAQLLQLSAKISCSQKEVRDFAIEIILWVSQVKESFVKAGNGWFTNITWDNLADIRSLIDEICGWAAERLSDDRWKLKNTKIESEIEDFRARLDDARKTFNDRSLIVVSGGLDAIFQFLWTSFFGQYILIIVLENLQRTQDEHFVSNLQVPPHLSILIYRGGLKKRILKEQEQRNFLEEKLGSRTVDDPSYIMQNKDPCDPGTRKEILDEINTWINDHSKETSKNFLWLVGPPGCGKSAITASIAEYCQTHEILGAQFFVNRNNYKTTDPRLYFPTVARDLYKQSESVEQHLHDALKGRKFSVDTPEKAAELFLDTIGKAARDSPDNPIVIIFDGLDETSRDRLESTAILFSRLFTRLPDYPNAKILISSRPEGEILHPFRVTNSSSKHVKELRIDIGDENSRRDIKDYLERRLTQIAKKHHLSSAIWPGEEGLERLVERASGLFIWAVTACKYIDMRLRLDGTEVLHTVLDRFDNAAMTDINTLYRTILEESYPQGYNDEWTLEKFRRLVGAILVAREPMSIHDLKALVDLRKTRNNPLVDVKTFVDHLRTLLVADFDDVTEDTVPRAHKSFYDFITSTGGHIPDCFHVDIDASNAEMALLCFHHLTNVYSDVHNTHYASTESDLKVLSVAARYSLRFALSHMPEWQGTTLGCLSDYPGIMEPSKLDVLLHRSSHPNHAGPLSFSVPYDHAFVRTSFDNRSLMWNPGDGSATKAISMSLHNFLPVFFSPGGTRIFFFGPNINEVKWAPENSYDLTMSSSVATAPFQDYEIFEPSFDGTQIAHATGQEAISLYSTSPLADSVTSEIPNRYQMNIGCLCLSQNCSYIALAPKKRSIIDIWDIDNERYITQPDSMRHEPSEQYKKRPWFPGLAKLIPPVECMTFAPDSTMLISCNEQCAWIWEIPACTRRHHSFAFKPGGPHSVAFSPDSQTVLAGSKEGTVSLWNPHTGEEIGKPWKFPTKSDDKRVYRVAFRSCGNIALAGCGNFVYVWDIHQATLLMAIPKSIDAVFTPDGSQLLYAIRRGLGICNLAPLLLDSKNIFKPQWTALSPGGNLIVSVATDQILCWRLDAVKVVGNPLKGNATCINAVAFSPDESRIAGAADDGTMYLWDSTTHELLSSLPGCVFGVSSLSFLPEGDAIVATLKDNQSVVLAVADRELLFLNEDERTRALEKITTVPKSTFFDLDKSPITFGIEPAAPNRRLKDVRWYPSRSGSVVWAYVNNHIIRAGKDGSFVVVPVGNPSPD